MRRTVNDVCREMSVNFWVGTAMLVAVLFLPILMPWPSVSAQVSPYGYWVPPSACSSSVSGNGTGTNGQTTSGASLLPVVQAQTSATGTNTHTYICNINPPSYLTATNARVLVQDAVFFYGVQTTALGTQVAVLASGTMNASIVFSKVLYPPSGASETPSVVTPVRADAGTLVITPVVASSNVATTTAGSFFSVKFQPATAISWNTDLQQLLLTVSLLNTATSATVTNSPGVLVHLRQTAQ